MGLFDIAKQELIWGCGRCIEVWGTAAFIEGKKLAWIGRVVRMDQERVVKKIFESKQEGR